MGLFSRFLVLVLVAIVIGFYPLLAPTSHRIDPAHFELIQEGMSRADVEAIFGVPPGQYDWAEPDPAYLKRAKLVSAIHMAINRAEMRYAAASSVQQSFRSALLVRDEPTTRETWGGRHGIFAVRFGPDGTVVSTSGPQRVRMVPPWQRWCKAIWER
jgi:hypothetical protein